MALRGTATHRKIRRLAKHLNICPPFALGLMEAIWHVTGEQHPDGGIGRITNEDIADEIEYTGDADELVDAIFKARLFDELPNCRIYVHDWHDWTDDHVCSRLIGRRQRFANGSIPRLTKYGKAQKEAILAEYAHNAHGAHNAGYAHNAPHVHARPVPVSVPEPDPAPGPEPDPVKDISANSAEPEAKSSADLGAMKQGVGESVVPDTPKKPRKKKTYAITPEIKESALRIWNQHPRGIRKNMTADDLALRLAKILEYRGIEPEDVADYLSRVEKQHKLHCDSRQWQDPQFAEALANYFSVEEGSYHPVDEMENDPGQTSGGRYRERELSIQDLEEERLRIQAARNKNKQQFSLGMVSNG